MNDMALIVNNRGDGIPTALAETEQAGRNCGLNSKQVLQLRLLAEELFGMMRGIAGDVDARYFVEESENRFALHLNAEVRMTQEVRKQLLSVSSQRKNAAAVGFMNKLKDMISAALLPDNSGLSLTSGFSLGVMSTVRNTDPLARQASEEVFSWSMCQYKTAVDGQRLNSGDAESAWDELEKSIVASIADEVTVSITGSHVDVCILKSF